MLCILIRWALKDGLVLKVFEHKLHFIPSFSNLRPKRLSSLLVVGTEITISVSLLVLELSEVSPSICKTGKGALIWCLRRGIGDKRGGPSISSVKFKVF